MATTTSFAYKSRRDVVVTAAVIPQMSREERLRTSIERAVTHCDDVQRHLGLPGLSVAVAVDGNIVFRQGVMHAISSLEYGLTSRNNGYKLLLCIKVWDMPMLKIRYPCDLTPSFESPAYRNQVGQFKFAENRYSKKELIFNFQLRWPCWRSRWRTERSTLTFPSKRICQTFQKRSGRGPM